MHVAGVNADPLTFEHIDPAEVGNAREVLVSELSGKGTVIAHAGGDLDDATAARVVERVKELEHRGFQFEAADGSFELLIRRETGEYQPLFKLESWRVIAEKRADGRVETEATIKLWVGSQRFVRTAEGNGPVHALDRALRAAIGERLPHLRDIKLVNYKVRILDEWKATGATTRVLLDASDGTSTWGAIGVHENVIEASLGRARGLARGGHAALAGRRAAVRRDPARPPRARASEEQAVIEVLRSRHLSLGPRVPAFEAAFAARVGAPHASAVSSGTAALHLALRAVGVHRGRRGRSRRRSRSWPRANAILFERARPVFVDIDPRDAEPRRRRRRGGDHAAHDRAAAGAHLRLPGRHARAGAPRAADRRGRVRGARRGPRRRRARSAAAAIPAAFGFYANKQLTTGEGGMLTIGSPRTRRCVDSERNQGRAPDMGWLDHDRLGFNYRLTDIACALGPGPAASGSTACSPTARGSASLVPRGAGRLRGAGAAVRGLRRRRARLVRVRRPAPARRRPRRHDPGAGCERGVQSKPYLPAIHLMSFYRERFGHREGEFPVCEDVAARSIALPFFPEMTEGQVAEVAEALDAVLYSALR